MLKGGILHPQLANVLARLRHMDTLVIGDAGLPIPKGVEEKVNGIGFMLLILLMIYVTFQDILRLF